MRLVSEGCCHLRELSKTLQRATAEALGRCDSLDVQLDRAYAQYTSRTNALSKNSFLQSLKAQNWVLFYALIGRHLEEIFPVIYTPTEAEAIEDYSHLFRRSEGLYLSPPEQDKMEEDFLIACEGRKLDLVRRQRRQSDRC